MSVKNLYIHVGVHKTGSSAFQLFCVSNRSQLKQQGMMYPDCKTFHEEETFGHHYLSLITTEEEFLENLKNINQELIKYNVNNCLISSEEFMKWDELIIQMFIKSALIFFDQIHLVMCLREQSKVLEGIYGTHVFHYDYTGSIQNFIISEKIRFDYFKYVMEWEKSTKIKKHILLYNEIKDDLVSKIFSKINVFVKKTQHINKIFNASLDYRIVETIRFLNKSKFDESFVITIKEILKKIEINNPRPNQFLSNKERNEFNNIFREDNNKILQNDDVKIKNFYETNDNYEIQIEDDDLKNLDGVKKLIELILLKYNDEGFLLELSYKLRDLALKYENSSIDLSLKLMLIANTLNNKGKFIKSKVEEYKNLIKE